jgi:AcrR family transcriptional regulator
MILVSERQREIIEAFFLVIKEMDEPNKITMDMIAERAGISRQGIYEKHFSNIGDIVEKIHSLVSEECEERMQNFFYNSYETYNGDYFKFFEEEILPLLYNKRDWLKTLYSTKLDSSWADYAQKAYTPYVELYLTRLGNQSGLADDFICGLIVRQVIAIVASWLTCDEPEAVPLFKKKFDYLIKTPTYELLFKNHD